MCSSKGVHYPLGSQFSWHIVELFNIRRFSCPFHIILLVTRTLKHVWCVMCSSKGVLSRTWWFIITFKNDGLNSKVMWLWMHPPWDPCWWSLLVCGYDNQLSAIYLYDKPKVIKLLFLLMQSNMGTWMLWRIGYCPYG
jgi:hypothetical protein